MVFDPSTEKVDLDAREVRTLGCLIEKELSTPDYYPMTLNSLTSACNQKTNREPVVEYGDGDVIEALDGLQRKRIVGTASSSHGRALKYRHALAEAMNLGAPQLSVLASLMLRGPETVGELRGRTSRMHEFDALEDVEAVLEELMRRDPPLVTQLPRRPGQKEARYAHLLAGEPAVDTDEPNQIRDGLESRITDLEHQVELLRVQLDEYIDAFETFRRQFE